MAPNPDTPRWFSLAEQVSQETDPKKLTALVAKLCDALESPKDFTRDGPPKDHELLP
jgi:hypothetical protein